MPWPSACILQAPVISRWSSPAKPSLSVLPCSNLAPVACCNWFLRRSSPPGVNSRRPGLPDEVKPLSRHEQRLEMVDPGPTKADVNGGVPLLR